MNYIENIYICLMAPLLISLVCVRGRGRFLVLFLLGGMTVCLLSSYISTFISSVKGADILAASMEISPMVEEVMKFLPIAFYIIVFEPERENVIDGILTTAIGFATFENVCYLTQNGASEMLHLIIRGFGTGAMHIVCAAIMALGLRALWNRGIVLPAGMIGLIAVDATFHGIYNILVSQTGGVVIAGYLIPIITAVILAVANRKYLMGH
ncbi:MAG: PrsW family glutamic-type intramembrane protease [Bacillota bacterium]|nr:PrsW family glutamic-type intramembrane protease [Bacillota bacterium]